MSIPQLILPCLRGVIGDWVYYSTLMTAKQLNDWVKTAKEIREAKSLDEELQRDLKERKKQIAEYLKKDNSHFFNSIIIGVFDGIPDWREFDLSSAKQEYSNNFETEYIKESMGLMIFNGDEKLFAIDGQHRVAGIQLAYSTDPGTITDDQYSVILVAHIDSAPGMRRTRKLFSDINKNAKPVAKKDKIIIDEQDLNAIVTRRILAESPYFNNGALISLSEQTNLDADDTTYFTNITNLFDVVSILRKLYKVQKGTNEWDECNVIGFKDIVSKFFDTIIQHKTEYRQYFIEKTLTLSAVRANNLYLLFRPVGLKLISRLYVDFAKLNKIQKLLDNINKISFVFPDSPFNKIVWNNGKLDVRGTAQTLMFKLSKYMLDESSDTPDELLRLLRQVTKNDEIQLPPQIV